MSDFNFTFGGFESQAHISAKLPDMETIAGSTGGGFFNPLIICDEHTAPIAEAICGGSPLPCRVLQSGEESKNWAAVESILRAAREAGVGRDGTFIGVGGGVIGDLTAFAASIYMRGCGLVLVSTTLLGMVDATLGGKTGFDLFGVKNLAGTFYPARHVYMPLESLGSLPPLEWKSGMAELIKTAVLSGGDFLDELESIIGSFPPGAFASGFPPDFASRLLAPGDGRLSRCVSRAVQYKGKIAGADPTETGTERRLLNLGHTFAHALESSLGLGTVSHGEAVAWGLVRACELGLSRGITPRDRAEKIKKLVTRCGYETAAPHPLLGNAELYDSQNRFIKALGDDKKKKNGSLTFIVPDEKSACSISAVSGEEINTIKKIAGGLLPF